jgi:hypothetical protein
VGRPQLVVRAVESALAQTLADLEVIVVVDGPDADTERALAAVADPRLVVAVLPRRSGQCAATNAGIARARAPWIGLLDDDDLWLPDKLERQLTSAARSPAPHPVIGGRVIARSEAGDEIWPRRAPGPGEPVSEYLFCRRSPFWGERLFQTSVILAPRDLMLRVPFREELPRHSDLDWLIRAGTAEDVGLVFPSGAAPVAVWSVDQGRARASHDPDWRASLEWIRELGERVTPRAYAAFLLTWLSAQAVAQGERSACAGLLRDAWRRGKPGCVELSIFAGIWALPAGTREAVSRRGRGGTGVAR